MIALYRGISALSRMISNFTRTPHSHASLVVPTGANLEAWASGGVRKLPSPFHGHTPGTLIDFYGVISLDTEREGRMQEYIEARIGQAYDYGGVLRFLTRRRAENPERVFCSELVMEAAEYAGITLLHAAPWEIAPGHLAWSTELYPLALEVDEGQWNSYMGRELCRAWEGSKS
jgi:uncharacterized protein YycO